MATLISNGLITSAVTLMNLGVVADTDSDQPVALSASQFRVEFDASTGTSRLRWSLDSFSGVNTSLADGFYRLTLDADMFRDVDDNRLDGDGDGTSGGDFIVSFHRLQGDADGTMVVDRDDMNLVNSALAANPNSPHWNADADLDRDDRITVRDRVLVARSHGHAIVPPRGASAAGEPPHLGAVTRYSAVYDHTLAASFVRAFVTGLESQMTAAKRLVHVDDTTARDEVFTALAIPLGRGEGRLARSSSAYRTPVIQLNHSHSDLLLRRAPTGWGLELLFEKLGFHTSGPTGS